MHIGAGHVHQSYKLDCAFSPTDAYVLCGSEDGEQVEVASWFPWQLQGAVLHVYLIHAPVPAVTQGLIVCNLPCLLLFCILGAEREEAGSACMAAAAAAAAGVVPRNGLLVIPSLSGRTACGVCVTSSAAVSSIASHPQLAGLSPEVAVLLGKCNRPVYCCMESPCALPLAVSTDIVPVSWCHGPPVSHNWQNLASSELCNPLPRF